jgi:diketogulonate reductase-like aldo/keto reductase
MSVSASYQLTLNCGEYRSFWTLTGSPGLLKAQEIQRLAAAYSCTAEQAVYRLAQLREITPLCGSTDEQHMREAIAASQLVFDTERHDYAAADSLIGRRDI